MRLKEVEGGDERAVAFGLFYGVQVVALGVLGDGHRGGRGVVHVLQRDGDELDAGEEGGAQAAFAADELQLAVVAAAAGERLYDAVRAQGVGQFLQRLGREFRTRLVRAALDVHGGNLEDALRLGHSRCGRGGRGLRRRGERVAHAVRLGWGLGRHDQGVEAAAHAAEAAGLVLRLQRGARRRLGA